MVISTDYDPSYAYMQYKSEKVHRLFGLGGKNQKHTLRRPWLEPFIRMIAYHQLQNSSGCHGIHGTCSNVATLNYSRGISNLSLLFKAGGFQNEAFSISPVCNILLGTIISIHYKNLPLQYQKQNDATFKV